MRNERQSKTSELVTMACVGVLGVCMAVQAEPFNAFNHVVGATVGVTSNATYRATFDGAKAVSFVAPTNCFIYVGINMTAAEFAAALTTTNVAIIPKGLKMTLPHPDGQAWIDSICIRAQTLSTGDVTWAAW
jgi:hypothetical protein